MGAFSFVCKKKGSEWSATCKTEGHTELEASAGDPHALESELRQLAIDNSSGGGVSTSFNYITPSSAVFVVSVGVAAAAVAAGGGAPAAGGGGAPAAAAEEAKEEKKEPEESEDEDMGFSLFD